MIKVSEIKYYEDIPFEEYLKIPGISFSWIKSNGVRMTPSAKMNLGSQVDNYLNEPSRFTGDIQTVKPISQALKMKVGGLYNSLKKQVSITARWEYNGMYIIWKGRPDWFYPEIILIDIKVTENIEATFEYFDYPNQISGYCITTKVPIGIIMAVNPKNPKKITMKGIPIQTHWWELQILKYGKPIT